MKFQVNIGAIDEYWGNFKIKDSNDLFLLTFQLKITLKIINYQPLWYKFTDWNNLYS